MSTKDSRLTAEERAALAHLEAAATADDPHLATRLRGSGSARLNALGSKAHRDLSALANRAFHLGWWGIGVAVVGLAMMVLAVSSGLWLGILGIIVAVIGLMSVAHAIERRLARGRAKRARTPPTD
jgi:Protein of unknown function (DUF3040)